MSTTLKQTFETSTIEQAVDRGYDCCQLKYDGIPCRIEVSRGLVRSYALYNNETIGEYSTIKDESVDASLLGQVYYGPRLVGNPLYGKTVLFDCTALGSHGLRAVPYRERFGILRVLTQSMKSDQFILIKNYPIKAAHELWVKEVESEHYKGLIFRKTSDPVECTILCRKYYKEFPGDGTIV